MNFYIGQIFIGGFNFAPRGSAMCDGQILAINQYQALFSLLGTTFGGDGRTSFGLPDLRGRIPIHHGNGPGLSDYRLGQKGGAEFHVLTTQEMPAHNHSPRLRGVEDDGNLTEIAGHALANSPGDTPYINQNTDGDFRAGSVVSNNVGGGLEHENRMPYNTLTYCISLTGTFPSRS